jgi:hypothetical protein
MSAIDPTRTAGARIGTPGARARRPRCRCARSVVLRHRCGRPVGALSAGRNRQLQILKRMIDLRTFETLGFLH